MKDSKTGSLRLQHEIWSRVDWLSQIQASFLNWCSANGAAHLFIGDSRYLAAESLSLRTRRLSEFVRVRKDEWEGLRKDIEVFVQNFETSTQKLRDLTKENNSLKEQLQSATQRLAIAEQKATADLQQTSQAIQKMRSNISRVLQQTEKEM